MGGSKSSSKREVYSNTILPQEKRNISNKQSNLTPKGSVIINNIPQLFIPRQDTGVWNGVHQMIWPCHPQRNLQFNTDLANQYGTVSIKNEIIRCL